MLGPQQVAADARAEVAEHGVNMMLFPHAGQGNDQARDQRRPVERHEILARQPQRVEDRLDEWDGEPVVRISRAMTENLHLGREPARPRPLPGEGIDDEMPVMRVDEAAIDVNGLRRLLQITGERPLQPQGLFMVVIAVRSVKIDRIRHQRALLVIDAPVPPMPERKIGDAAMVADLRVGADHTTPPPAFGAWSQELKLHPRSTSARYVLIRAGTLAVDRSGPKQAPHT